MNAPMLSAEEISLNVKRFRARAGLDPQAPSAEVTRMLESAGLAPAALDPALTARFKGAGLIPLTKDETWAQLPARARDVLAAGAPSLVPLAARYAALPDATKRILANYSSAGGNHQYRTVQGKP